MLLSTKTIAAALVGLFGLSKVLAQVDEFECAFAPTHPVYAEYIRAADPDVSVEEYEVPTTPTTLPPTKAPTKSPTKRPTFTPTMAPTTPKNLGAPEFPAFQCTETQSVTNGCDTTYVYCPGKSTCFNDKAGGAWGWSIDLSSLQAGQTLKCPIYAGAGKCDINKGNHVGNAYFTQYSFSWQFFRGVGGRDFHFYAGFCPKNDGGKQATTGSCDATLQERYDRTPGQYTIIADTSAKGYGCLQINSNNYKTTPWKFGGSWPSTYKPFPIGAGGWRYVAAHSSVCGCSDGCWDRN